jgi:hypothetical protein
LYQNVLRRPHPENESRRTNQHTLQPNSHHFECDDFLANGNAGNVNLAFIIVLSLSLSLRAALKPEALEFMASYLYLNGGWRSQQLEFRFDIVCRSCC